MSDNVIDALIEHFDSLARCQERGAAVRPDGTLTVGARAAAPRALVKRLSDAFLDHDHWLFGRSPSWCLGWHNTRLKTWSF